MNPVDTGAMIAARREAFYRKLGALSELAATRLPGTAPPWPTSTTGRLRFVRSAHHHLLVTDGLSDPWDPEVHGLVERPPLGFELVLAVALDDPAAHDENTLAASHYADLLFGLTDFMVPAFKDGELDLVAALQEYRAVTVAAPPRRPEVREHIGSNGMVGFLIGLPLVGHTIDAHIFMPDLYEGLDVPFTPHPVGLFPVTLLCRDEYETALSDDYGGSARLAEAMLSAGLGFVSSTTRASILS